jgi:hypothetical protein
VEVLGRTGHVSASVVVIPVPSGLDQPPSHHWPPSSPDSPHSRKASRSTGEPSQISGHHMRSAYVTPSLEDAIETPSAFVRASDGQLPAPHLQPNCAYSYGLSHRDNHAVCRCNGTDRVQLVPRAHCRIRVSWLPCCVRHIFKHEHTGEDCTETRLVSYSVHMESQKVAPPLIGRTFVEASSTKSSQLQFGSNAQRQH